MLGVMIGSAAIVLVVTIGIVGKTYVMSMIEGIGTNIVYASLDRSGHTTPQDEITIDDLNAIRTELPYVSAAAGVLDRPAYVYAHGRSLRVYAGWRHRGLPEHSQTSHPLRAATSMPRTFLPVTTFASSRKN